MFITSFAEFTQRFGRAGSGHVGAHMIEGFFGNGGGRAWVSRLVSSADSGNDPSTGTLAVDGTDLVEFSAGYRGQPDPGQWADDHVVRATPTFSSQVQGADSVTATQATLASVAGFSIDARIVVSQGANRHVSTVTAIDPIARTVTWADDATPGDFAGEDAVVATLTCLIEVLNPAGDPLETFENVTFGGDDDRYIVAVINDTVAGSRIVTASDSRDPDGRSAAVDYLGDAGAQTDIRAFDA